MSWKYITKYRLILFHKIFYYRTTGFGVIPNTGSVLYIVRFKTETEFTNCHYCIMSEYKQTRYNMHTKLDEGTHTMTANQEIRGGGGR